MRCHTLKGLVGEITSPRQILNTPLDMVSLGFRCNNEAKGQGGERLEFDHKEIQI